LSHKDFYADCSIGDSFGNPFWLENAILDSASFDDIESTTREDGVLELLISGNAGGSSPGQYSSANVHITSVVFHVVLPIGRFPQCQCSS